VDRLPALTLDLVLFEAAEALHQPPVEGQAALQRRYDEVDV
jgi:hypothetical protein